MTKIVFETAPYQSERQAAGLIDLAQRFEWRLQWEKSQLENWQAYQSSSEQHIDAKSSVKASGEGEKEINELLSKPQSSADKLTNASETRRSHLMETHSGKLRFERPTLPPKSFTSAQSTFAPTKSDGARNTFCASPRAVQSGRATQLPLIRHIPSQTLHVYQMDGKVEVALRCIGLNEKSGMKLMAGLKKDLASLGLKLTRLILNGEMFWRSEPSISINKAISDRDEYPIDKIY